MLAELLSVGGWYWAVGFGPFFSISSFVFNATILSFIALGLSIPNLFLKSTKSDASKGGAIIKLKYPRKYCMYMFSLICSTVFLSSRFPKCFMIKEPNTTRGTNCRPPDTAYNPLTLSIRHKLHFKVSGLLRLPSGCLWLIVDQKEFEIHPMWVGLDWRKWMLMDVFLVMPMIPCTWLFKIIHNHLNINTNLF